MTKASYFTKHLMTQTKHHCYPQLKNNHRFFKLNGKLDCLVKCALWNIKIISCYLRACFFSGKRVTHHFRVSVFTIMLTSEDSKEVVSLCSYF